MVSVTRNLRSRLSLAGPALAVWAAAALWLTVTAMALFMRPPLPIDETRYLSVTWEMWLRHDWLVPYLNGAPYSQKPPLLFWLVLIGWKLFGVSELWARAVGPLAGLAAIFLTARLGQGLWPTPQGERIAAFGALMLAATFMWAMFATATMFETLITTCALTGAIGIVEARRGRSLRGWALCALALGFGVLAKGPVILVYVAPVAVAAAFLPIGTARPPLGRWFGGCALALLGGAAIGLGWALPAAIAGGHDYANSILWAQTSDRVVASFAHRRPLWWYLPLVPLLTLPWSLWPAVWRGFTASRRAAWSGAEWLLLIWLVAGLTQFSAISGKQIHYLLPLLPGFVLLAAAIVLRDEGLRFDHRFLVFAFAVAGLIVALGSELFETQLLRVTLPGLPSWGVEVGELIGIALLFSAAMIGAFADAGNRQRIWLLAAAMLLVFAVLHLLGAPAARSSYDLRPMADRLAAVAAKGGAIAFAGDYQGEFNFLARLRRPVETIDRGHIAAWLAAHPHGRVVAEYDESERPTLPFHPDFEQTVRRKIIVLIGPNSIR